MCDPGPISPGLDPDAWNLLLAASHIAEHHTYVASRLPGYPVPEYAFSLVAGLPTWIPIFATLLVSTAGFLSFRKILRTIEVPEATITALAFICTPVVLISCLTTMDYMWGISFVFLSFLHALRRRSVVSGLFFGISVGSRITSLLMFAPLVYLISSSWQEASIRWRQIILFLVAGVGIAAICYLPVISTYGLSFLTHARRGPFSIVMLVKTLTVDTFGIVGSIAIAFGLLYPVLAKNNSVEDRFCLNRQWTIICWMVVGIYAALFAYLPLEAGYLIPLVPFCLLLLRSYISRSAFRVVACGLVLSPFLIGLDATDRPWSPPESPLSIRINSAGRVLSLDVLSGPVTHDFLKRNTQLLYADSILTWSRHHSEDRVILVTGVWFPILTYLAHQDISKDREPSFVVGKVRLTGLLDRNAALDAVLRNSRVYFLPGQDNYNEETYGVDLRKIGARPIQFH